MERDRRRIRRTVIAFALGLGGGGFASLAGGADSITPQASVAGLALWIERVAWLADHMEHSGRIPMPPSMMPDMPEHGQHRLSVAITIYNEAQERQRFRVAELELRSSEGHKITPSPTTTETVTLSSGQLAHLFLQFDVPSAGGDSLRLVWRRDHREQVMRSIPLPPTHSTTHQASDGRP